MVSVVIPTYGRPDRLSGAIESVFAQTYRDFEIIVVDDNPPESEARSQTVEMMKQYEGRVVYLRHERNKNGAAARNTGIRAAKGEYIAFLDDDDIYMPRKLELQTEFLNKNPQYGGVYGWRREKGREIKPTLKGDLTALLLMCSPCAQTTTLLLRKDKLLEIGGFNESYRRHQDLEMLIRFCRNNILAPIEEIISESGLSGDVNNLHCKALEDLKDRFLGDFSEDIKKQPKKIQKKIYCVNYAAVWADYLHRGKLADSARIYFKWAVKYPICFNGECIKKIITHIKVMPKLRQNGR